METVNELSNQDLASEIRSLKAKVVSYEDEDEVDRENSKRLDKLRSELATRVRTTQIKLDAVITIF